jgi:two-component system NtrC family sensor kinase
VSASGGSQEHWDYERAHPDTISRETIVGRVALAGEPVQIADLAIDSEYHGGAYKVGGYRTLLGVPIRTDEGLIGAFGLGRLTVAPFTDHRSRDRACEPLRRSGGDRHPRCPPAE